MDPESILPSELSQTEKKQKLYNLPYTWNLNNKQTEFREKEVRLVVTRGVGQGGEVLEKHGHKVQTSSYKINQQRGLA